MQTIMKVDIKGQPYKLVFKNECFMVDNDVCLGLTNKYSKEITINVSEDTDYKRTMLHELMHAYFWESGLSSYCSDETLVDWLALQLPQISNTYNQCLMLIDRQKNKK